MALITFQSGEWGKSMILIAIWTGKEDKANVGPVYKIMRSLSSSDCYNALDRHVSTTMTTYDYECDDYRQTRARQNDRDTVDTEPSRTEMPATTNEAFDIAMTVLDFPPPSSTRRYCDARTLFTQSSRL
ncbi:hypothetical protein CI102_12917 [Trichoderma harzianum]|nr:hypothetical protein CI102_12917 [Trichoderma harzianum]